MVFPIAFSYPRWLFLLAVAGPVVWAWRRSLRAGRASGASGREWASLILRLFTVILLVLCLAGVQWVRAGDELAVVLLLDRSDSVDAAARAQGLSFARAALSAMGPRDRGAVVAFGRDAWVERRMGGPPEGDELGALYSAPDGSQTDVGRALRLGLAMLPAGAHGRLVLLSDGQDNVSGAPEAAALAAAGGATLDVAPLHSGAPFPGETWLESVEAPAAAYEGERVGLLIRVGSGVDQPALLRVFDPAGQRLLVEREVRLRAGENAVRIDLAAGGAGFAPWEVQLVPEVDASPQNNTLGAFTLVRGAPEVLLVSADEGEAQGLRAALESAGLRVALAAPSGVPADLAALGSYGAVVLANVPASAFSARQMEALRTLVRDVGRGLVCVGGESSYGVGGYYGTPLEQVLPVEMAIRDPARAPPLGIVFVVDRSGSMDAASREGGGVRKVDLAKEAVLRSLELLKPGDQVGVIVFDDAAQWVYPAAGGGLAEATDLGAIQSAVAAVRAGGGTDIYAGLSAASSAIEENEAQAKHVILLTDGGASREGLDDLVARLRAGGATLSTVGVGQNAAAFLPDLALNGGGRYHYTDDPTTIPAIFSEETALAQRAYLVEGTFVPAQTGYSEIIEGFSSLPPLHGYVATSIKPAARMVLASDLDDPVLAQWRYGLGRSVAWTSDAKGRWAADWMAWQGAAPFWGQAARWTLVEPDRSGLEPRVVERGEQVEVAIDVDERAVQGYAETAWTARFLPALSAGRTVTTTLRPVAPGQLWGSAAVVDEGVYLVQVLAQSPGEAPSLALTTGYVRPYSAEYRVQGTDLAGLRRLAEIGEGRVLDPGGEGQAARVFAHDFPPLRHRRPAWPWLAALAICLLPLDVGLRRVAVGWGDVRRALRRAGNAIRRLFSRRGARLLDAAPRRGTSRLLEAKRRASRPPEKGRFSPEPEPLAEPPAPPVPESAPSEPSREAKERPEAGGETVSRLLAAKRRAAREEDGRQG